MKGRGVITRCIARNLKLSSSAIEHSIFGEGPQISTDQKSVLSRL